MAKKERISHASAEEIQAMRKQGQTRSDWAAAEAMNDAEVERSANEDDGPLPEGWEPMRLISNSLMFLKISAETSSPKESRRMAAFCAPVYLFVAIPTLQPSKIYLHCKKADT